MSTGEDTFFGATYGKPKTGKTVASLRGFSNGIFVGPKNCFLPSNHFLGVEVKTKAITRLSDLYPFIELIKKKPDSVPSLVVSDVSILANEEVRTIRKPRPQGGEGYTGWDIYNVFEDRMMDILVKMRELPITVIMEFHEQPPKNVAKKGAASGEVYIPTCPQVPGWAVAPNLPGYFDFVAQVEQNDNLISSKLWPYAFSTRPDGESIRGDRLSIFPDSFPLNLREGLYNAGIKIPRHKTVTWMDDEVETLSESILKLKEDEELESDKFREVLTQAQDDLSSRDMRHVRWVILDALDRAELKYANKNKITNLIDLLCMQVEGE